MLKVAAIFKNGMILQRNSCVRIWGTSDHSEIRVSFSDELYSVNTFDNKWTVDIKTGESLPLGSDALKMIISAGNNGEIAEEITIDDILLGDVWLAGGQSNMELELQNSDNAVAVMEASDYPYIRFYNVPKFTIDNEELHKCEENTAWKKAIGNDCADMSAVAYYFALKLHSELQIPIGIIDCYVGGTSATCWVNRDTLDDIDEVQAYLQEWDECIRNKTEAEFDKEMDEYKITNDKWCECITRLREEDPNIAWGDIVKIAGECPWPPPKGYSSMQRPFGLYDNMVSRVVPYGLTGFIYYQAEEDVDRGSYYHQLNSAVIRQWREDFSLDGKGDNLPFYITQLPMFISIGEEDSRNWGVLRSQQEICSNENPNSDIAVICDCGELNNIHPTDKKTPGTRLALTALANHYGNRAGIRRCKVADVEFAGNECRISLANTYGGLYYGKTDGVALTAGSDKIMLADGMVAEGILHGFEVSENGVEYYSPQISVKGDTIILAGQGELTDAQYAYFNYGIANVYSKAGMPLTPFKYSNNKSKKD